MEFTRITYTTDYMVDGPTYKVETIVNATRPHGLPPLIKYTPEQSASLMVDPHRTLNSAIWAINDALEGQLVSLKHWGITRMVWTPEHCLVEYEPEEQ